MKVLLLRSWVLRPEICMQEERRSLRKMHLVGGKSRFTALTMSRVSLWLTHVWNRSVGPKKWKLISLQHRVQSAWRVSQPEVKHEACLPPAQGILGVKLPSGDDLLARHSLACSFVACGLFREKKIKKRKFVFGPFCLLNKCMFSR